ncbi:MAG: hypothetical protein IPG39_03560 [Bacteroidetes bacterium]|nr:hypothetical protein [Bacteroidota bacterium]
MTKLLLTFLLLVAYISCISQNRTNTWILSYQWLVNDSGIDFNAGIADTFSVWKDLEFFVTNASICDTNGQLLFYTNGVYIANKENDTLYNCQNFNPGYATEYYGYVGLAISQGAIILPYPESDNLYYLIYVTGELLDSGSQLQPLRLSYSIVDMQLDSGLGGILDSQKNVSLVADTLVWGRITACKHANGRDWWIISHRWNSDLYYRFLLTPDSISGPFQQQIGSLVIKDDICGQACFSPQGDKFCYINRNYNFDYMQFDRCTWEFL